MRFLLNKISSSGGLTVKVVIFQGIISDIIKIIIKSTYEQNIWHFTLKNFIYIFFFFLSRYCQSTTTLFLKISRLLLHGKQLFILKLLCIFYAKCYNFFLNIASFLLKCYDLFSKTITNLSSKYCIWFCKILQINSQKNNYFSETQF